MLLLFLKYGTDGPLMIPVDVIEIVESVDAGINQ
jgi:hypothetical protein